MNPLFDSFRQNQNNTSRGGFDLNTALQNLARQIAPTGMTAEQIVRQNIQNGTWDPEKFNQYAQIADRLTGGRR